MTARILMGLVLILAGALPMAASAVAVEGLYRAEMVVTDKSQKELHRAKRDGLEIVLVKVSGSAGVVEHPLVIKALDNVESYVSESSYHSKKSPSGLRQQTVAVIHYAPSVVDRLLTNAGQPIWPADRPELLVWMVVDRAGADRSHISRELMPEASEILQQQMALRGQKLVEPLLDLEDQLTLSARDAWDFKRQPLVAAARRYKVENWCVLRCYETSGGQYRGTVQVEAGAHSGIDNINARSLKGLIRQAVDIAVDRVAKDSSFIRRVRSEEFTLLLENVGTYSDYKAAIKLLDDLEMVRSVRVAAVVGDRLDLRLAIDGGHQGLLKMLRRNKRLQEVVDLSGNADRGRFSWR